MSYLNSFRTLLKACSRFPEALPLVQLNGYLSGIAAGPRELEKQSWQEQILGTGSVSEEVRELAAACVRAIQDDIIDEEYRPQLSEERFGKTEVGIWMKGFERAVDLDEPTWRIYNDAFIETGKSYFYLRALADPEIAEILGIRPSRFKKFVKDNIESVGLMLEDLYHGYRQLDPEQLEPLPQHSAEELKQYSDDALIELLSREGDLLPRSVVDECVQRRAAVLPQLRSLLEYPRCCDDEHGDGPEWWAPVHAINILGAMEGQGAADTLLYAMEGIQRHPDAQIWDLFNSYWAALFSNKQVYGEARLEALAFDQESDWLLRISAFECLIAAATDQGADALDRMLARIAQCAADPEQDYHVRMMLGLHLLDHPREVHRAVLEQLVAEQEDAGSIETYFKSEDVAEAYERGEDNPEWARFTDFLSLYDPEAIRYRQLEGQARALRQAEAQEDLEDTPFEDPRNDVSEEPYVRETPKIGRNDPCPCGSGKKYKKCCGR